VGALRGNRTQLTINGLSANGLDRDVVADTPRLPKIDIERWILLRASPSQGRTVQLRVAPETSNRPQRHHLAAS
jgi:hypothetical protein